MHDPIAPPIVKSLRIRMRAHRAFSLIELLVVIAIVAVLLAILFTIVHAAITMVRGFKGSG